MSDNLIQQITLECLTNKSQYKSCLQNKVAKSTSRQDKRFYKKRIIDLTRDLLSKPSFHEENILADVKYTFDNYIKTCISYFKTLDNNDILQEEYKEFDLSDEDVEANNINSMASYENKQELDKLLMRSIKMGNPLDKFVKKKLIKPQDPPIIPKQKDIDLADPELKTKGIIKRKKKENVA